MTQRERLAGVVAAALATAASLASVHTAQQQSASAVYAVTVDADALGPLDAVVVLRWDADVRAYVPTPHEARTHEQRVRIAWQRTCTADEVYLLHGRASTSTPLRPPHNAACTSTNIDDAAVFPAARISGVLQSSLGGAPKKAALGLRRCRPTPGLRPADVGRYPLPLTADGRYVLRVPAGCVALTFDAPEHRQFAVGSVTLAPESDRNLGQLIISPGASARVRVLRSNGAAAAGVRVSAVGIEQAVGAYEFALGGGAPPAAPEKVTDSKGWAELTDLALGPLHLLLHDPQTAASSVIFAGDLTLQPPLVLDSLPAPAFGAIEVRVASDLLASLAPDAALTLQARPVTGTPVPFVTSHEIALSQPTRIDRLLPGAWRFYVRVHSEAGKWVAGVQEVEVAPDRVTPVVFHVDQNFVQGTLLAAGSPVSASLTFFSNTGAAGDVSDAITDDAGRFTVFVPRPGVYNVRVDEPRAVGALQLPRQFTLSTVDVTPGAELNLVVPNGVITGRVLGVDGRPAVGAIVDARRDDRGVAHSWSVAGADGRFLLTGLAAGEWRLESRRSRTFLTKRQERWQFDRSDSMLVTVGADAPEQVTLTLEASPVARGVVVLESGDPAASAQVLAFAGRSLALSAGAVTEMNGELEFELPNETTSPVDLIIASEGGPVSAIRRGSIALGPIQVPVQGALVTIRVLDAGPDAPVIVLRSDTGALAPMSQLLGLGAAHTIAIHPGETRLVIPRLAPGQWEVLSFRTMEEAASARATGAPAVAAFTAFAGGVTYVDVVR